MSFSPDFSHNSIYSPETGFKEIRFAGSAPVLEVELKEIQEITREETETIILNAIGDNVLLTKNSMSITNGTFEIEDAYIIVNGSLIYISYMQIDTVDGDSVYLNVWEEELSSYDDVKKWGNQQESVIDVNWVDDRIGEEISKRTQIQFDLTKDNYSLTNYVKLGENSNGNLINEIKTIDNLEKHLDDLTNPHDVTAEQLGAQEILNEIKKVDGNGSELNADLLDSLDSTQFLRSDENDNMNGDLTFTGTNKLKFGSDVDIFYDYATFDALLMQYVQGDTWTRFEIGDTTDKEGLFSFQIGYNDGRALDRNGKTGWERVMYVDNSHNLHTDGGIYTGSISKFGGNIELNGYNIIDLNDVFIGDNILHTNFKFGTDTEKISFSDNSSSSLFDITPSESTFHTPVRIGGALNVESNLLFNNTSIKGLNDIYIADDALNMFVTFGTNTENIMFRDSSNDPIIDIMPDKVNIERTLNLTQNDISNVNSLNINSTEVSPAIADAFGSENTKKNRIVFTVEGNDPCEIVNETSSTSTDKGVLHLIPSDNESGDSTLSDYVSIHGKGKPEHLKLFTNGDIENNVFKTSYDTGTLSLVGSNKTIKIGNYLASNNKLQFRDGEMYEHAGDGMDGLLMQYLQGSFYTRLALRDSTNGEIMSLWYAEDANNPSRYDSFDGWVRAFTFSHDGNFDATGSKNFKIPHPNPELTDDYYLKHSTVETNTAGDNLYRYQIRAEVDDDLVEIKLPDYWEYLNINPQVFVSPKGHYGSGYGEVVDLQTAEIHCEKAGEYNIMIIATRDDDYVDNTYSDVVPRDYNTGDPEA